MQGVKPPTNTTLVYDVCVRCVYECAQLRQVILPSGKRYQLHYDNSSRLTSLVTPSQHRHEFQRLIMPGIDRLLYRPPQLKHPYIVDYDTRGRLLSVIYPQLGRRVTYNYTSDDQDFDMFYDSGLVRHRSKLDGNYTLQTNDTNYSENCSSVIERTDNVNTTTVQVTLMGCKHQRHNDVKALFVYRRDRQRRVTSLDAVVARYKLPTRQLRYSDKSGQVIHASPFTCKEQNHHETDGECVSEDQQVDMSRQYDSVNRLTQLIMSFNSHAVFTLQVSKGLVKSSPLSTLAYQSCAWQAAELENNCSVNTQESCAITKMTAQCAI